MMKPLIAALLAASCLAASPASADHTMDEIQTIEREYARLNGGRLIPDDQLEYYLDRSASGWSMARIVDDMDNYSASNAWRPQPGWIAREVVCSSIDNRYRECRVPFQGTPVITAQISRSPCVKGSSWGAKPGVVWVDRGCRAEFGIVAGNTQPRRTVDCKSYKGRYRECPTGMRGRVQLAHKLDYSRSCVEGRSWGQKAGLVWVNRGCRARFESVGRPGPRDDYQTGGWVRDTNYAVTCDSVDGRRTVCTWDNRYGTPRLIQQISSSACIEGRDWGYDVNGGLWVNSGCRARFGYAQSGTYPSTGWVRDNNYAVECSSVDGRRAICTWDTRYGTPRLIQQISTSACVEGRDWGYDSRGNLWVDAGCRARFGFR